MRQVSLTVLFSSRNAQRGQRAQVIRIMPDPPTTFSGIFVSYRRADAAGHAGRLYDTLVSHFGADKIFMDVDTIDPGEDFVAVIEKAVASCDVLIAVIGSQWLQLCGARSEAFENSTDFVRIEIGAALRRNIRVIPVLVQRAPMPTPLDLPEDLASLSRRNAIELSDYRWQFDVNELIGSIAALGIPVIKPVAHPDTSAKLGGKSWHRRLGSVQTVDSPSSQGTQDHADRIHISKKLLTGIIAAMVLISIIAIILVQRTLQSARQQTALSSSPTPPQPPPGMVYIPAGEILLLHDLIKAAPLPATTYVSPFFMDIFEVTCEQYKKFLDANPQQTPPPDWINRNYPTGWARKPVTGVDWDAANAYAAWSGKRLPNEAEWEYAAKGTEERKYPWGNVWTKGLANTGKPEAGPTDGMSGLAEVGSHKGASPFGVYDMVGNAWEWTSNSFGEDSWEYDSSSTVQDLKVIRGGSWATPNKEATTTFRRGYGARGEPNGYSYTGFRLARSIDQTTNH